MDKLKNYKSLKSISLGEGISLFGVADISEVKYDFLIPKEIAERFNFGISIGYRLSSSVLDTIIDAPNQIYYFHYQRANILLD